MSQSFFENLEKITSYLYKDNLSAAIKLINQLESSENKQLDQKLKIRLLLLKSRFHRQKREFTRAKEIIEILTRGLFSNLDQSLKFRVIIERESLFVKLRVYQNIPKDDKLWHERNDALSEAQMLLDNFTDQENKILENDIAIFYDLLGLFNYYSRQINKSRINFEKSSKTFRVSGDTFQYGSSILNLAYSHLYLGNFADVEKFLQECEKLSNKFEDKEYIFWIYQGHALLNSFKGNMQTSLRYYKQSMDIIVPLNEPVLEADLLHILGIIYWERSELQNALEAFNKLFTLPIEIVNHTAVAVSLFYMILIHLEMKNSQKANEVLQQLQNIKEKSSDPLFALGLRLAKALILKSSPKLIDKLNAKTVIEELSSVKIENSRLSLILLTQLAEILLIEYKAVEDPEILIQLKELMDELYNIGKSQESALLIADSYLILSKIALIEYDLKTAEQYLIKGLELAESKSLLHLAKSFSREYDILHNRFKEFTSNSYQPNKNTSFADFENAIHNIGRIANSIDEINIVPENPVLFLVINEAGGVRFTKFFRSNISINEHLLATFITAINSFTQDMFDSLKPIERINYYEYTIAIKPISNSLLCYIFTGDTYYAFKKLQIISERIIENEILFKVIKVNASKLEGMLVLNDNKDLIDIIDNSIGEDLL